jgi:inhibitor of KinA sporulation pathway (predicted exonuclease)
MVHTWGDETGCLDRAAHNSEVKSPWGRNVFDLSYAFRSSFNLTRNLSLSDALNYLGLKFEGKPHDALTDAKNTARLHVEMMRRLRNTLPEEGK